MNVLAEAFAHEHPSVASLPYAECKRCPLYFSYNPVLGHGPVDAKLVVVGEGPGHTEIKTGKPFSGQSGALLDQMLKAAGTNRSDVYTTYIVLCHSVDKNGDDSPPPAQAVDCCRPRLLAELGAIKPAIILSVGASAAKALLRTKQGITEIQGVVEHRDDLPASVLPTFHPAAVLHAGRDQAADVFEDIFSATKRAVKIANGSMSLPDRNEVIPWRHVISSSDIPLLLHDILNGKAGYTLAIDVETDGLDVISQPLLQVAIGNAEKAVVIEADVLKNHREVFCRLLTDNRFTWLIHNSSFDLQWLKEHFGIVPPNVIDTLCLALGHTERGSMVGLKRLSREWLNAPYYEDEVHQYLGPQKSGWANVPRPILAKYAAKDVVYTARMYPILDSICREEGTRDLVYNLLIPAQRLFAEIERHGVLVDRTYLATLEAVWQPKIDAAVYTIQDYAKSVGWKREHPIYQRTFKNGSTKIVANPKDPSKYEIVGYKDEPLNPGSPLQLAEFLFDVLKLAPPDGERTTGRAFRDKYPSHEFTRLHEDYSVASHMMSAYVKGIEKHVRADGRVHPNARVAGTVTGRLSYSDPAIQTIPREDYLEDERAGVKKFDSIKRIFLPSPGFVWGETDFQALELRCMWALTGDEGLGEAILSGDFHRVTAGKLFKIQPEDVTTLQRHASKRVTFGIAYGRQAPAIADQLTTEGIPTSVETAQGYVDGFFRAAPKYREWFYAQHRQALETGRSVTPFGRVRRWNLITRENRAHVLNQSVNFPIQSVASDITLSAAIRIQPILKERGLGSILFLVHDSLCYQLREGREAEGIALIESEMKAWPFDAKDAVLDVETKIGDSWGTASLWKR